MFANWKLINTSTDKIKLSKEKVLETLNFRANQSTLK